MRRGTVVERERHRPALLNNMTKPAGASTLDLVGVRAHPVAHTFTLDRRLGGLVSARQGPKRSVVRRRRGPRGAGARSRREVRIGEVEVEVHRALGGCLGWGIQRHAATVLRPISSSTWCDLTEAHLIHERRYDRVAVTPRPAAVRR
jgi:hypothetical protein